MPDLPFHPGRTLLDESGHLARSVPAEQIASWKQELPGCAVPLRAAQLHLWLGEWELGANEDPKAALTHFAAVTRLAPASSALHGLALYDRAVTAFRSGAYRDSLRQFTALLHAPVANGMCGYDRTACALFARHAAACSGYHDERSKLGIPEPPKLDPQCGVAGLAVCLRALHLPYDEKTLLSACRVTGLGSNMGDLVTACQKLGGGKWVTSHLVKVDEAGLKRLPLPAVAYVEHDHFIAVTGADAHGVTYVCSDCGCWPGGEVHLTWAQWRRLDPGLFLAVVKPGSFNDQLLQRALASAALRKSGGQTTQGTQVALASPARGGGLGLQTLLTAQASALTPHIMGLLQYQAAAAGCGNNIFSLHCLLGLEQCAFDLAGTSCGCDEYGAAAGEPVNLATLEEEYSPPADDVIFNPVGPALSWGRVYNSLRSAGETGDGGNGLLAVDWPYDFGHGWSFPYNTYYQYCGTSALAGGGTAYNYVLVMPNKSRIPFYFTGAPSATGSVATVLNNSSSAPCKITTGSPGIIVDWRDGSRSKYGGGTGYTQNFQGIAGEWPLLRIENRIRKGLNFNYTNWPTNPQVPSTTTPLLTSITNDNGTALLTVVSRNTTGQITKIQDAYQRTVVYDYQSSNPPATGDKTPVGTLGTLIPELWKVSQLRYNGETDTPNRFTYTYQLFPANTEAGGQTFSFLRTITRPHPNNPTQTVTATINYNNLYVSSVVDGNGNTHTYTPNTPNQTTVMVTGPTGNQVYSFSASFDAHMNKTNWTDGLNNIAYNYDSADPYKLVSTGQIVNGSPSLYRGTYYTWNTDGTLDSVTAPTFVKTVYGYDKTIADFPFGEVNSIAVFDSNGLGYVAPWYVTWNGSGGVNMTGPSGTVYQVRTLTPDPKDPTLNPGAYANYELTTYKWSNLGNLTEVDAPGTNTFPVIKTTYNYTTDGTTFIQNEALGQPITVTNNLGKVWHNRYDSLGHKTSSWDPYGKTYQYVTNYLDQLEQVIYPATGQTGTNSGMVWWPRRFFGGPVSQAFVFDERYTPTYDAQNPSTAAIQQITYTYGAEGEVTGTSGNTAEAATTVYDPLYRIKQISQQVNGTTTATTTCNYYLPGDQVPYPSNPTGYQAVNGALKSVVLPNGDTTTYDQYDPLGDVTQTTKGGVVRQYNYDGAGQLTWLHYPNVTPQFSQDIQWEFDSLNRLTKIYYPSLSVGYKYFAGNSYPISPVAAVETKYLNNTPPALSMYYFYNHDGTLKETYPGLSTTNPAPFIPPLSAAWIYSYDAAQRPTSVINPTGDQTTWSYYDNNSLSGQWAYNGNGSSATRVVGLGIGNWQTEQPYRLWWQDKNGNTLYDINSIKHDGAGRITSLTRSGQWITGTQTDAFTYDASGQLKTDTTGVGTYNHSYDNVGDPTTFAGGSYTFNNAGQLTGTGFVYDTNGNPTTYGGKTLTFDVENRLTSMPSPSTGGTDTYTYRPDGLRSATTFTHTGSSALTRYILYDGDKPALEYNLSGQVLAYNTFGPAGLVSRASTTYGTANGVAGTAYFVEDERQNITGALNPNGTVKAYRAYSGFANGITGSGSMTVDYDTAPYSFGVGGGTGALLDETGMTLFGHRYYDLTHGRWLTRDPIGMAGGMNLYAYNGNDPINFIDPSGFQNEEVLGHLAKAMGMPGAHQFVGQPTYPEALNEAYAEMAGGGHTTPEGAGGGWACPSGEPGAAEASSGSSSSRPEVVYHYTDVAQPDFGDRLKPGASATSFGNLNQTEAVEGLGITRGGSIRYPIRVDPGTEMNLTQMGNTPRFPRITEYGFDDWNFPNGTLPGTVGPGEYVEPGPGLGPVLNPGSFLRPIGSDFGE